MNIRGALCLIGLWLGTMDDPTAVNDTEAAQALLEMGQPTKMPGRIHITPFSGSNASHALTQRYLPSSYHVPTTDPIAAMHHGHNQYSDGSPEYCDSLPKFCDGLNNERIASYAESNGDYCYAKFEKFKGKWRSKDCAYNAPDESTWREKGWKTVKQHLHCPSCSVARKHMNRHMKRLEEESKYQRVLPTSSCIKTTIASVFLSIVDDISSDAIQTFMDDKRVKEGMLVLAGRGDADICVTLNSEKYRIYLCESLHCSRIMIKEFKSNNCDYCKTCLSKNKNNRRSKQRMKNNFDKHIQPDSKTPITALPAKMISARTKNNKQIKRVQKRKIVSLTKQIGILKAKFKESVTVTLDGSDGIDFLGNEDKAPPENDCGSSDDLEEEDVTQHQNFMAEMEGVFRDISADKETYRDHARDSLLELLSQSVQNEKKTNGYECNHKDVTEMVDFIKKTNWEREAVWLLSFDNAARLARKASKQ